MEKNDKQINEKQIDSCSILGYARPNTLSQSSFSGLAKSAVLHFP